jgi:hypothetical protein
MGCVKIAVPDRASGHIGEEMKLDVILLQRKHCFLL